MSTFFRSLLHFLFHLGYFGPFVMGILDSSFLFLPFGNDILVVALVARHHEGYLFYVLSAVCGSATGVFFLDLITRRLGEEGIRRIAGDKRFNYLKRKIEQHGGKALVVGCLAPPPFPFTMVVATNSALNYPKRRLLAIVAVSRAVRFLILGALAIKFGRVILHWADSEIFKAVMMVFVLICAIGSGYSITKWFRRGRAPRQVRDGHPSQA